jgi:hypothetical protein
MPMKGPKPSTAPRPTRRASRYTVSRRLLLVGLHQQPLAEETEQARRRLTVLLAASTILAESPTPNAGLEGVARLMVPLLADACLIEVVLEGGHLRHALGDPNGLPDLAATVMLIRSSKLVSDVGVGEFDESLSACDKLLARFSSAKRAMRVPSCCVARPCWIVWLARDQPRALEDHSRGQWGPSATLLECGRLRGGSAASRAGMTKSHHRRRPTCQTRSNESAPGGSLGVQVIHCSTPPLASARTHPGTRPIATFPSAGLASGDVFRFRAAGLPLCPGTTAHGGQSRSRRTLPAGYFLSTLRPGAVAQ